MVWWWQQQQKDLPAFLTKRCWLELPLKGAPSRRSSLKTCHRHVFLTLGPSRVQVLPRSNEKSQASRKRYLTFLAGADGLVSPAGSVSSRQSATGARSPLGTRFWSGCGRTHWGAGEGRCFPVPAASPKEGGAGLVLRSFLAGQSGGQIASLRGSSTTGQDSYNSQGSRSMQAAGLRFPSKSQATVSLRTVNRSRKMASSRRGANTPPFSSRGEAS